SMDALTVFQFAITYGSAGKGRIAGRSRLAYNDARVPSRLRNRRLFRRSSSGVMPSLSSATEKNFRWRNAAKIQRSATRTAFSTLALSLGLYGRAGRIAVP